MSETQNGMPALFADLDITIQDPKDRPIKAREDIQEEMLTAIQWLYDNGKKLTTSFKDGGATYRDKNGEEAAKLFVNDAKDVAPYVTAKKEHTNGVTVLAVANGIVVTVSVGQKRGRK